MIKKKKYHRAGKHFFENISLNSFFFLNFFNAVKTIDPIIFKTKKYSQKNEEKKWEWKERKRVR